MAELFLKAYSITCVIWLQCLKVLIVLPVQHSALEFRDQFAIQPIILTHPQSVFQDAARNIRHIVDPAAPVCC